MFRAKTVMVLGAGASAEVGFPIGSELLKQIVSLTHITFDFHRQKSGDPGVLQALKVSLNEGAGVEKLNEHLRAGWQLSETASQAMSIDNAIDALEDPKVELIGKIGIARAILRAEESSTFFKPPPDRVDGIVLSKFENTWYSSLTKILTENVRKSQINSIFENLSIINFNYDRSLEQYLPYSLASYYGVHPDVIREIMQALVVHRPYGVTGRLPWQPGQAPAVGFGNALPAQLAAVAQQIRTFTEQVDEGTERQAMRAVMAEADRIVFLGFAFHRQNVELIAETVQDHCQLLATAYKVSRSDQVVIEDELRKALDLQGALSSHQISLAELMCAAFFQEYWRTLTADRSYDGLSDYLLATDRPGS